ncbi:Copia protein, partial [Mucuna pruriens]
MGRMIGVAKEQGGLYYLQHTKIRNNTNKEDLHSNQRATSETWTDSQTWLYHKCLGHPPFGKESIKSFKFDVCQSSKHHHATLSPNNGVVHELTCVNTPQQNGVAKRKIRHLLEGDSYLEIEPIIESLTFPTHDVIESLPFPIQDVQVQVQEVTKPILVLEQVQLSKSEISIPKNHIEDVTNDMLIALRKGKQLCIKYPIYEFVCTNHLSLQHQSFIVVIDAIKTPTSIQKTFAPVSQGDHTLFIKYSPDGKLTLLLVYADDMIVIGDDEIEKLTLKEKLATQFEMKELGKLKYFLRIEVAYSKQCIFISQRNTEVEFRAIAYGICEGLWMKIILDDLRVKYEGPIKLLYENNSAISIVHNPIEHDTRKHIEIDKYFIKEKLNIGLVVTTHVPTRLQVVDVFTKGLPTARFQELNDKLDIHLPT